MSFSQIFKTSFLEGYTATDITLMSVSTTLVVALLFGIYLFFLYRFFTRKTFYSKSFNLSIPLICMITAAIIMTIQSNLVVSLGMVGALSIVRFRTAVKDPMDLVFLYWAIAVGIITGAGLNAVALIATALVTIALIILDLLPVAKAPVLLVVNAKGSGKEKEILSVVEKDTRSYTVKSRTLEAGEGNEGRLDLIVELRVKDGEKLIEDISAISGVSRCSLMNHDGEVTF